MSKRPDIVNELPDGRREEIHIRRVWGPGRSRSQTRRIRDSAGSILEVWHEAFDHQGTIVHQHQIYPPEKGSGS
jgi:hypothetical protein